MRSGADDDRSCWRKALLLLPGAKAEAEEAMAERAMATENFMLMYFEIVRRNLRSKRTV